MTDHNFLAHSRPVAGEITQPWGRPVRCLAFAADAAERPGRDCMANCRKLPRRLKPARRRASAHVEPLLTEDPLCVQKSPCNRAAPRAGHLTAPGKRPAGCRAAAGFRSARGPWRAAGCTCGSIVRARRPGRPRRRAQLEGRIAIVGVLTATVLGIMLCVAAGAGRFLFARRRLAAWDKAWREVGTQWTRQL